VLVSFAAASITRIAAASASHCWVNPLTRNLQARALRIKSEQYSELENSALTNYTHGLTAQVIDQGSKDAEKCEATPSTTFHHTHTPTHPHTHTHTHTHHSTLCSARSGC
jgi:hypothetical protein